MEWSQCEEKNQCTASTRDLIRLKHFHFAIKIPAAQRKAFRWKIKCYMLEMITNTFSVVGVLHQDKSQRIMARRSRADRKKESSKKNLNELHPQDVLQRIVALSLSHHPLHHKKPYYISSLILLQTSYYIFVYIVPNCEP